ncbi:MAG TPA: hypothetical protein VK549_11670 [Acidimicrobiia bacterium]|nr:hypothetical protein [Acidimicrobiia bacterium]
MLAATGVWLWFRYVPTASSAWPGRRALSHDEGWIRTTHRLVGHVVVVLALAMLVLVIARRRRSGVPGVVAATAMLVTAVAASFTGFCFPGTSSRSGR